MTDTSAFDGIHQGRQEPVVTNVNAEVVGGVPLMGVIGTPRTMGENLGARLKPRLQVLSQYLAEQLCSLAQEGGHQLNQQRLREQVRPAIQVVQRHEPSLWMELEAMAYASELPIEDLLIIHGYGDLLSYFGSQMPAQPSTFVSIDNTHTQDGVPYLALCWYLDPALFPYLTLLRRIPTHGPATLCVTLAGLSPMIGFSEAGVAVASNELRVRDGTHGLFTSNLLAAMLNSPGIDDAVRRGQAGPRHGGAAIHGLAANGERFSLELSGQIAVRLSDPMMNSPRVHTNHPLDETIMPAISGGDGTSKLRLEQTASQAVGLTGITPAAIAGWFGFSGENKATSRVSVDSERVPISMVLTVIDPSSREMHVRRSGAPGGLETIKL